VYDMTDTTEAPADESQPEKVSRAPARKRGRPRKSRGAATSSDKAPARWTVRGVPTNVRDIAAKAAGNRGMTVGDWLAEAVVAYSKSAKSGFSADGQVPATDDLAKAYESLSERLTIIEKNATRPWFERLFGKGGK